MSPGSKDTSQCNKTSPGSKDGAVSDHAVLMPEPPKTDKTAIHLHDSDSESEDSENLDKKIEALKCLGCLIHPHIV